MSAVQLIAVFSENKLGQLEKVTQVLAEAGINIQWVTIATSKSFGVIKLLVDRSEVALQLLKQRGHAVSLLQVLAVEVPDRPGGLHGVSAALTRHHINVQNASGYVSASRAILLIEADDLAGAQAAAAKEGLRVLSHAEAMRP